MSNALLSHTDFTEADKKNCPFYHKIGACRHGDTCNREHHRPLFSTTVLIKQMYYNPMIPLVNAGQNVADVLDAETYQLAVDDFYEEICDELATYGQMEDVQVLENLNDHMIGLVYVKYTDEEDAEKCLEKMHGRFYGGRQLHAEYSPVADFREARCRTYDDGGSCIRGAYCNFMHVLTPSKALMKHITMKHRFQPCTHGVGDMRTIGSSSGGSGGYHKGRTDGRDRDGGGGYDRYERSPESDRGRGGGGGGRRDRSRSRDRNDRNRR